MFKLYEYVKTKNSKTLKIIEVKTLKLKINVCIDTDKYIYSYILKYSYCAT